VSLLERYPAVSFEARGMLIVAITATANQLKRSRGQLPNHNSLRTESCRNALCGRVQKLKYPSATTAKARMVPVKIANTSQFRSGAGDVASPSICVGRSV
jgi:hypothetical protein